MPTSHHREKHKSHLHPGRETHPNPKAKAKTAPTMAIIGIVLGLAIVYFSGNATTTWLIVGAAIGAVAGYLFGHGMDRMAAKK